MLFDIDEDLSSLKNDFEDICKLVRELGKYPINLVSSMVFGKRLKRASLEEKTKDFTAIFPNIVDRTIDTGTVEIINRVIEIKNANLIRLILTAMSKENANKSTAEILKQFHRNVDDLDFIDFQLTEEVSTNAIYVSGYKLEDYEDGYIYNQVPVSESLNDNSFLENVYKITGIDTYDTFIEEDKEKKNDSKKSTDKESKSDSDKQYFKPTATKTKTAIAGKSVNKNGASFASDKDVRKMNSLAPTLIELTLPTMYKGEAVIMTILIGVKSKIYPANQEEILKIIDFNKKSKLFKFIQMSTGEIKFFKDFIFNIDYVKNKAGSNSSVIRNESHVTKLWSMLQKRSRNKKNYKFNRMDNASIASLTLSTKTIDELRERKNIDLLDVDTAFDFVNSNGILHLIIVDEVLEIVYIMSDNGEKAFTEMTFDYLDKEISELKNGTIKKSVGYFG